MKIFENKICEFRMEVSMKEVFGITLKNETAYKYTLTNQTGTRLVVSDFGAVLLELHVADKNGKLGDVVLGYPTLALYEANGEAMGATVGRNSNRIAGAVIEINGVVYPLVDNDNGNNLHSNPHSYFKRMWTTTGIKDTECGQAITFDLLSPDGDQGYPGTFKVSVTYTLTSDNMVKIHYEGESDKDTIVNMTNHSYFNLAGQDCSSVEDHIAWIKASTFTVANEKSIPTGEIVLVEGTPMDFRVPKVIGLEIDSDYTPIQYGSGYDHNWVLENNGELELVASLYHEASGRKMEVYTDLPGVQVYTGNFLGNTPGKGGVFYPRRGGVCFETQYFPDAIHHANFPSPILKAGEKYDTTTCYKFFVE